MAANSLKYLAMPFNIDQGLQATPSKKRMRFTVVGIIVAALIITVFLVAFFSPPRAPLKQNVYKWAFDDQQGLLSLNATIHYETEADGTWRRSEAARYNITFLVKPTYVKESVISEVNVTHWWISGIYRVSGSWPESPPTDYEIELMDFWLNQSAWCVASTVYQVEWPYGVRREAGDTWTISFLFVIRETLINGTSRNLNWGDSLFIYMSG